MHRMEPSKTPKTKNGDTSSPSQQPPPNDSSYHNYMEHLPPIDQQHVKINHVPDFWLGDDELYSQSFGSTSLNLLFPLDETMPYYRGIVEEKIPIQYPYNTKTMRPFSVETIHQGNFACAYGLGKMQDDAPLRSNEWMKGNQDHCCPNRPLQSDEAATISSQMCQMDPYYFPVTCLNSIRNVASQVPLATTTDVALKQGSGTKSGLVISPSDGGISSTHISSTINEMHEAGFVTPENHFLIEPYRTFLSPSLASDHCDQKIISADFQNSEKLNQSESKKKRPKTNGTGTEGVKGCNCKKSLCMKLYCECFAAERFCNETCSCQGCSNKQEYADKVSSTREKIKSRNAFAFAPKIIQNIGTHHIPSNTMENGNLRTPSSAKHVRGCTCRRSKCDKKYCECYAGEVGCSSGCRCEGCENSYGKKNEHDGARDKSRVESVSHIIQMADNTSANGVSPPTTELSSSINFAFTNNNHII